MIKTFEEKLSTVKLNVPQINTAVIENMLQTHPQAVEIFLKSYFNRVEKMQQGKRLGEKIFYWVPWVLVLVLCIIIFRIAIGGLFQGTIF